MKATAAKIRACVQSYRDLKLRAPGYIAIPEADYRELTAEVNDGLPPASRYLPNKFEGINLVIEKGSSTIRCLP